VSLPALPRIGRIRGDDGLGAWLFRHRTLLGLGQGVLLVAALLTTASDPGAGRGALALAFTGLGLLARAFVAGTVPTKTSGRLVQRQQARTLNTTGAYSVVRHPLYLANLALLVGVAVRVPAPWLLPAVGILFAIGHIPILAAEERYLAARFGPAYRAWATRTPRLVPRPWAYVPPVLPLSVRTVLRRETSTWLAVALAHGVVDLLGGSPSISIPKAAASSPALVVVVAVAFTAGVTKILKYRTRLLHLRGR